MTTSTQPQPTVALLAEVGDHPSNLLSKQGRLGDSNYADGLVTAAGFLRGYETRNGVVFAALDKGALAQVREAYDAATEPKAGAATQAVRLSDLVSAIDGLLGMTP